MGIHVNWLQISVDWQLEDIDFVESECWWADTSGSCIFSIYYFSLICCLILLQTWLAYNLLSCLFFVCKYDDILPYLRL